MRPDRLPASWRKVTNTYGFEASPPSRAQARQAAIERDIAASDPEICRWCGESGTFWILDPDWREGGRAWFCCWDHVRWYAYAVCA